MTEIKLWEKVRVPRAAVISLASRFIQDSDVLSRAIMAGPFGADRVGHPV